MKDHRLESFDRTFSAKSAAPYQHGPSAHVLVDKHPRAESPYLPWN